MKRLVNILGLVGIIAALILVAVLLWNIKGPEIIPSEKSARTFAHFPVNQPQLIEFEVDEGSLARLTQREWRDQMLDWLLYTVVSDSGSSLKNMNQSLFDLQAIRYGYTKPLANFEFGQTRSAVIQDAEGKDLVVAILPSCTAAERLDYLGHIADRHRKDLGEIPGTLVIFEYDLGLGAKNAHVTRRETINGQELFQEKSGYYEGKIETLQDLQQFLAKIDDITFAQIDQGHLTLGGRKIKSQPYRGIRVEDVAAIWQSEAKIQQATERFNAQWKTVWDDFDLKWTKKFISHSYLAGKHEANRLAAKIKVALSSLKDLPKLGLEQFVEQYSTDLTSSSKKFFSEYLQEYVDVMKQEGANWKTLGLKQGSGFSLDPTYDYEGLRTFFKKNEVPLNVFVTGDNPPLTLAEIKEVKAALYRNEVLPYLILVDKLKTISLYGAFLGKTTRREYQFQSARYDGDLQGTEVGMVLFYTDLLAKLWAIDYLKEAPNNVIVDFKSMTNISLSPVYEEEFRKLPNTRLWFGTQDKGFQVADEGKKLLFGRIATRVYAASSNPLTPGVEVAPAADSAAFLGWWNDHYEEVAQYEREYERLNEIIKWSLLISWLNEGKSGQLLGFLSAVPVKRNNWFPDWARQQQDLGFSDWDKIKFYEKGYKNTLTESMPILFSDFYWRFGEEWNISGGVSLASKQLFKERPSISWQIGKLTRRSNLNYQEAGLNPSRLGTLEGCQYNLKVLAMERFSVVAQAKAGTRLRSSISQLANLEIERTISPIPGGLTIQTKAGGFDLGNLNITRKANGFCTGWRGRDIDTGEILARGLSKDLAPDLMLLQNPDVETFLKLPGDTHYLIKLQGSDRWLKIAPEAKPSITLAEGWQSRVADPERGFRNLQLAWIDTPKMPAELGGEGYLVFEHLPRGNGTILKLDRVRGPPLSGSKALEIECGDIKIAAQIDPETGNIFLPIKELPETILKDPSELTKMVGKADFARMWLLSWGKSPRTYYKTSGKQIAYSESYFQKPPHELARDLVHNPELFKRRFNKHLADGLKATDAHLAHNEPVKAIHELNDLIGVHGAQPELTLRKGIAQLRLHRLDNAVKEMTMDPPRPIGDRQAFFAEYNERIGRDKLVGIDRQNLDRLADYTNWQDLQARKMVPPGKVTPVVEGDHLDLVYDLSGETKISQVTPDTIDVILKKRFELYTQDSPGLNNLDWNVSFEKSFRQAILGNLGKGYKLYRGDIGHFKPGRMHGSQGKIEYKRVTGSQYQSHYKPKVVPAFYPAAYIPYNPNKDDKDKDKDKDDDDNLVIVISTVQGADQL